jgi:hypothetical protein
MVVPSNLFYCYFRFYIDDSDIESGLNQYCKEWSKISTPIGYNYKEYRIYSDNPGGLAAWCNEIGGYITINRETGFMDAAPSDAIYDSSLVMGKTKLTSDKFVLLNSVKRGLPIYLRKITAQDAGITHKIKITSGESVITHPVMYTFDSSQIETLTPYEDILDESDVDTYEYTADLPVKWLSGGVLHSIQGTVTDLDKMLDKNKNTYGQFNASTGNTWKYLVIDMQQVFTAIAVKAYNILAAQGNQSRIDVSNDLTSWVNIALLAGSEDFFYGGKNNFGEAKYVRVGSAGSGATVGKGKCRVYQILIS